MERPPTEGEEPGYRPRRDDHLVEPMFAGLGLAGEEPEAEPATPPEEPAPPWIARLLAWLARAGRARP